MSKPNWAPLQPLKQGDFALVEDEWNRRRLILDAQAVVPEAKVTCFFIELPTCEHETVRRRQTWVNWTCRNTTTPWPPEDDPHVFAQGTHRSSSIRVMTWVFPSPEEALALIRKLWGVEVSLPEDLRTVLS